MTPCFSVSLLRRYHNFLLFVDLHSDQCFVEPLNHLSGSEDYLQGACSLEQDCRGLRISLLSPWKCRTLFRQDIVRDNVRIRCLLSGPSSQGCSALIADFLLRAL